jgi:Flp pilus assembly pilin Flp
MFKKFLKDERGLELGEYAAAASLIAIATVVAFQLLGTSITERINVLANRVK